MNKTETSNADCLQRLVRRLYEARQEAKQAKQARRELSEKIGNCEMAPDFPGEPGIACYNNSSRPKEKWCDVCKQKLPVWENYRRKTNLAAAALRELIRVGATLPPNAGS